MAAVGSMGRVFGDYGEASTAAESIGYPVLMQRAADAVQLTDASLPNECDDADATEAL